MRNQKPKKPELPMIQMSSIVRSGPIPDAGQLEHYERICPGLADRIISMAEKQSEHRQYLEKTVVKSGVRDSLLGIISGFAIGIVTVVSGALLIYSGHDIAGAVFSGTGLTGLVGVFVYGTRSSRAERESQREKNENNQ